jgi:hypothetical protein
MRHVSLTIFILISLPLIFLSLELLRKFSLPSFFKSADGWIPLCVAVLATGMVLSFLRLANGTDRDHHRH